MLLRIGGCVIRP